MGSERLPFRECGSRGGMAIVNSRLEEGSKFEVSRVWLVKFDLCPSHSVNLMGMVSKPFPSQLQSNSEPHRNRMVKIPCLK